MKPIYTPYQIKSFKHDGHVHRIWLENWRVPKELLVPEHVKESFIVLVNFETKIQESDGKQWVSKTPGITFFIPYAWYNIVALIEPKGVRYYCNIASPRYIQHKHVVTYIDYDLDVNVTTDGQIELLDEDEYLQHQELYRYDKLVKKKVSTGLAELMNRIEHKAAPFQEDVVRQYFADWKEYHGFKER